MQFHKFGWLVVRWENFLLNGRQLWQDVLNNPDDKNHEQKVYGLDYSPSNVNIHYLLKNNPEYKINNLNRLKNYSKKIFEEFSALQYRQLSEFFGALGIILFGFGLFFLIKLKKRLEFSIIIIFLVFVSFPPLLHGLYHRRIAIIIPIFLMVEGLGISFLLNYFKEVLPQNGFGLFVRSNLKISVIIIILLFTSYPLLNSLMDPAINKEYHPSDFKGAISSLKSDKSNLNILRATISTRKGYFSYFAEENYIMIPYADYNKLVNYCKLNKINYLFLEHRFLSEYPFMKKFNERNTPEFRLIYRQKSSFGDVNEVYRFKM